MELIEAELTFEEICTRAADAIERYGWTQFGDGDTTRGFCAGGAIYHATGNNLPRSLDACVVLKGRLEGDWRTLAGWNDRPERTQAEVVGFLRAQAGVTVNAG